MGRVQRTGIAQLIPKAGALTSAPQATVEKPKSIDRIDTKRSVGTDGKAFVAATLKDIAARTKRGEKVRVAFDIDDTLANTHVRTLEMAKAWDAQNGTHFFDRLTLAQVGHTGLDTAKAFGLPWRAEQGFDQFWNEAFWNGANFVHDAPMPDIVALAKAAKKAGADVYYLTGRTTDSAPATLAQLRRFGLDANAKSVVTKPDVATKTVPFKIDWLRENPSAFFFTESLRDVAGIQASGISSPAVLLDGGFKDGDGVRADTPVYPRAV